MAPGSSERAGEDVDTPDGEGNAGGPEKRQWFRRTLPFGWGAVLEIGGRSHVVGLRDLSEGGALVLTRAAASVGDTAFLKLSVVSRQTEAALPCTVVRIVTAAAWGPQRGLAVRFDDPNGEVRASIAAFVARAPSSRRR
jgi:Tfp pilus assembly protein PilZ